MKVLQIYRTESDWCALVESQGQRATLTYKEQPEEAAVLDDADTAFASLAVGDAALPDLGVEEGATLDDKKAVLSDQVAAAAALASTEPELADVAAALKDVGKQLDDAVAADARRAATRKEAAK